MNHPSGPDPAGPEIAPLVAAAELVDLLQRLDLNADTRTLSGVPLPLETAWCEQGLGPAYVQTGDTRWAAAWRMLLAHARTGWNWVADLKALELTVTGTPPHQHPITGRGAAPGQWPAAAPLPLSLPGQHAGPLSVSCPPGPPRHLQEITCP